MGPDGGITVFPTGQEPDLNAELAGELLANPLHEELKMTLHESPALGQLIIIIGKSEETVKRVHLRLMDTTRLPMPSLVNPAADALAAGNGLTEIDIATLRDVHGVEAWHGRNLHPPTAAHRLRARVELVGTGGGFAEQLPTGFAGHFVAFHGGMAP